MKLGERYPEFVTLPTSSLLEKLSRETLFALLPEIAESYVSVLPMWAVLSHYGQDHVSEHDTEKQVNCLWLSHGSKDTNRSARYFATDRHTGGSRGSVYCYKCQRAITSFWYVYRMEHDFHGKSIADTILYIEACLGIRLPRTVILDFDPDTYYSFSDHQVEQQLIQYFSQALKLRVIRDQDPGSFLQSLYHLYTEEA